MNTVRSIRPAIVCTGWLIVLACSSPALAFTQPPSAPPQPIPLSPEATEFLRATILLLAPHTSVDEDDWGRTKRVQSGLNVRLDGLQLRTSRRWKEVRHGTWNRAEVILEDPGEDFDLAVSVLPQNEENVSLHRIRAGARVRVRGRQQRWTNGVKLYSISGEGIAHVVLHADVELRRDVVTTDGANRLRVLPEIRNAHLQLTGFQLRRVGHAKGSLVRESGRAFESIAKRLVSRESDELTAKINEKIRKKPERFEIPLGVFAVLAGAPNPAE